MLISKAMNERLNEQIANEMGASQSYLAISCMFDNMGLKVLSRMFRDQADEEREHALKFVDFMLQVGADVRLPAIPEPQHKYGSVVAAAEASLKSELEVTRQINEIAMLAEQEKDFATRTFIHWFVDEQVEEVSSMTDLVQQAKMAGNNLLQLEDYLLRLGTAKPPKAQGAGAS